jgi:YVTN family beta-propeller protein
VLDEVRERLYVFTRFDNAVSVVDTAARAEIAHVPLYNPEPSDVVAGRPFLYDATVTSSNGEASCAACHVFGDFDSLAWDLGNPDDVVLNNPNPFRVSDPIGMSFADHHPMKGPMATQSLRGMANHGPMHWRGDRTGGNDPGGNALDEVQAFLKFNVAFDGLLGRGGPIPDPDMEAFTTFILQVTYPPNPVRALDNSLTADESTGQSFFMNSFPSDVFQSCNGCHALNPSLGFFGSDGFSSFEFEPQLLKIPHLRNLYQKVGMFGMPAVSFFNSGDNGAKGDQVRGFGFLHDGSVDTVFRFHNTTVFNQTNPGGFPIPNDGGIPNGPAGDPLRRQIEAFMLAFDSNLAPIVGQQETLDGSQPGPPPAGTTELLSAKRLVIKDDPVDPSRRKIVLRSIDTAVSIPAPGGADDPRCGSDPSGTVKAGITVTSSATGETHHADLVCDLWTLIGQPSAPVGYKYSDPQLADGTAKKVLWKAGRSLKAILKGNGPVPIDFDLTFVSQGNVFVTLESGTQRECLRCNDQNGLDGSDGRRFQGKDSSCLAPSACFDDSGPLDRVDLLRERAEAFECDLVVKGTSGGLARSWLYRRAQDDYVSDRVAEAPLTDAALRALAVSPATALTYTCVPPGSGARIGLDRDEDFFWDRDEIDAGSDPADPGSTP